MKDELNSLSLVHTVEAVYLGGTVEWSEDGRVMYSACGNHIKAVDIDEGRVE